MKLFVIQVTRRRSSTFFTLIHKMDLSLRVQPISRKVLQSSSLASGPNKANCFTQVAFIHRLHDSECNFEQHQYNLSMQMLRNREGLNAPLKMNKELHAARQIGRLPILQSSNLMEDVLLGRDEMVTFNDILGVPETHTMYYTPQIVIEDALGIL